MTPDYMGEPRSAGRTMKSRTAFWCALSIWVLTLAVAGGALIFNHLYPLPPALAAGAGNVANGLAALMFIEGFTIVGALLIWKRSANPIGWLISATGASYGLALGGGSLLLRFPQTRAWGHWFGLMFFLGLGLTVFVLLLFPTGSLPSGRWRPVAWAAGAGIVAWALGNTFAPVSLSSGTPSPIRAAWPAGRIFDVLAGAGLALVAAAGLATVVSLVFRYRQARTVEREQLLARLEEIRASRQRLVAAQDAERRRIERNIHDGAQQQLVALAIKLSITESMIGTDTEGERELLAELREDAAGAVEELRDLARGIYPPLLAGEGLVTALQAQARKAPVPTSVTADGVGRYPQDVEAAVYFCVLEALQNVAKYAGATRAEVRLAISGHDLTFEVTDDGAGIDPGREGYGTGLQGMADRLHAHGGSLAVRSSPGRGTTVAGRIGLTAGPAGNAGALPLTSRMG